MVGHLLKKNIVSIAVVVGVLLIGGAFAFNTFQNNKDFNTKTLQINNNPEKIAAQTVAQDSDGDGLKDWEEILLGTDPQNPDTDGDGTNDKEEIDQSRDPLIAGPNDYIKNNTLSSDGKIIPTSKGQAITKDLAIELFTGYVELKKEKNLNKTNSEQLITEVINKTVKIPNVNTYSIKDITVVKKPKREVIDTYDTGMKDILKPDPTTKNDIVVLKQILSTKNTDELAIFDLSMKRYKKIVAEMLSLTVPKPVSIEHIATINALVRIIGNVKSMKTVFTDPLGALVGVKEYDNNGRIFLENLLTIGKYLELNRTQK